MSEQMVLAGTWPIDRPFRTAVSIPDDFPLEPFTPFAARIDFGSLLAESGTEGRFDRNSVVVTRLVGSGGETIFDHLTSEHFVHEDAGDVSWVVQQPAHRWYHVYFDLLENGPHPPPDRIGLVGHGDVLRYNSGGPEPLDVGIAAQLPVFVDWTGDGRLDLIAGSIYANTIGFPYHGTWFFRNVGSNADPVYDDFIRLEADGEYLDTQVFAAVDWAGDGVLDLVGKPYGKNEIHAYRNTGERDRNGLPILAKLDVVDFQEIIGPGGQCGAGALQLIDLAGDGRLSLVAVVRELQDKSKYGHIFGPYYDNHILVFPNTAPAGAPPSFGQPDKVRLPDGSPLTLKGSSGGSLGDWNGDGVWDVMLQETVDSRRAIRLYENTGSNEVPCLVDAGMLLDGACEAASATYVDDGSRRGFVVYHSNRRYGYLEDIAAKPGRPILRDRGPLMQMNGRVSVGNYSWPWVCDWDGDGGRDIVAGAGVGRPHLLEEVGRRVTPEFRPPRLITAGGKPIWHTWGNTLTQTGGERTEGYWQPSVADWDGDGLPDLIAPVGISKGKLLDGEPVPDGRLFFYRNCGSRSDPRFEEGQEILLEDGTAPVASHTAFTLDWDGDGRQEIVAFDFEGQLCLFRPKDDPALGPLTLLPGVPLKMQDGREFCDQVIYEFVGRPWGMQHVVCDWRGTGVWDIIVGTREMLILFRNLGSNDEPAYDAGEIMNLWGKEIKHSVHNLRPSPVDWDGLGRVDLVVGAESGWFHLFRRPALDGPRPPAILGEMEERR